MRYVVAIGALLLLIAGLVAVKGTQIGSLIKMGKEQEKAGPPPETIATAVSKEDAWESTLSAVGTIAPVKGVSLSNDAPGVVSAIHFDSGAVVKQGDVLVELDSTVERAQLASVEARRELARLNAGRSRALVASDSIPKAQLDNDEALVKSSQSDLGALQAQIARKIVRAPFSGKLGIRAINIGQYLSPGTTISSLEAMDSVFVDFTLPQQNLADVAVGTKVRVTLEGDAGAGYDGVVSAVDPAVDSATRSIRVRASVPNTGDKLRPGMFANVSVVLPEQKRLVSVPAPAVIHASYGDSIFIVEEKKDPAGVSVKGADGKPARVARQQFVRTGTHRGDFVAIAEGVKPGQEVVVGGAFKLRNGAGVVVNNDVVPDMKLSPTPENR
ncbi:MAG: putative Co/Zn/Cd efflux system rane fusion protein [Myxococcaceae bacterium]|nr:putative Co/Zn/Cd efflux system rane fusion protein [Myxococcaceae bacterium]